jgi:hypothetical protein
VAAGQLGLTLCVGCCGGKKGDLAKNGVDFGK